MSIKDLQQELETLDEKVFNTDRDKRQEKARLKKQIRKKTRKKLNDIFKDLSKRQILLGTEFNDSIFDDLENLYEE